MLNERRRSVVVLLFAVIFCKAGTAESFVVTLPAGKPNVKAFYFLTGPFGGRGSTVTNSPDDAFIALPTTYNEQAGGILKMLFYSTGCQLQFLSVDLNKDPKRKAAFVCEPLPTMRFQGIVRSVQPNSGEDLDLEVSLVVDWGKQIGYMDGPMTSFVAGRTQLRSGQSFDFELPDFSKDAAVIQQGPAMLQFALVDNHSGAVKLLRPNSDLANGNYLTIQPAYKLPISFIAH